MEILFGHIVSADLAGRLELFRSLDKGSDRLAKVPRTGTFGVNVLATGQSAPARRCETEPLTDVRTFDTHLPHAEAS